MKIPNVSMGLIVIILILWSGCKSASPTDNDISIMLDSIEKKGNIYCIYTTVSNFYNSKILLSDNVKFELGYVDTGQLPRDLKANFVCFYVGGISADSLLDKKIDFEGYSPSYNAEIIDICLLQNSHIDKTIKKGNSFFVIPAGKSIKLNLVLVNDVAKIESYLVHNFLSDKKAACAGLYISLSYYVDKSQLKSKVLKTDDDVVYKILALD